MQPAASAAGRCLAAAAAPGSASACSMSRLSSRLLLLPLLLPLFWPAPQLGPSRGHEQLFPLLCTGLLPLLPAFEVLQMLMPLHRLLPACEGGCSPHAGCACSHVPTLASPSDVLPCRLAPAAPLGQPAAPAGCTALQSGLSTVR